MDIQDTPITLQQKLVVFLNLKGVAVALIFPQSANTLDWNLGFHEAFHQTSKDRNQVGPNEFKSPKIQLNHKRFQMISGFLLTIPNTY